MRALELRDDFADEPRATMSRADLRLRSLVDEYFDFVWRSLRALGVPPSTADDAAQQVFLVAAQKLETIERGAERAFLFSVARGIAANERRSRLRRREVVDEEIPIAMLDESPDPEDAYSRSEARGLLEQIMESMDDKSRPVFVLFELEGLTTNEIAVTLGIPLGTVGSRLRRARTHFDLRVAKIRGGLR